MMDPEKSWGIAAACQTPRSADSLISHLKTTPAMLLLSLVIVRAVGAQPARPQARTSSNTSAVETLDARIGDAERASTAASKSADTICRNAGFAMGQREQRLVDNAHEQVKQCAEAMQTSSDAIGFLGILVEQRSVLTGEPLPARYACNGKPSLGAPHQDAHGHYTVCPKDPADHSLKFWIITQARLQVGSPKETASAGGGISWPRYGSESECRAGIAKYEDYPSKVPYALEKGVIVGDVCVEVFIPDVRELILPAKSAVTR